MEQKQSKCYIFIACAVNYIGGAQNYLLGKIEWLHQNGWEVVVFASDASNVVIDYSPAKLIEVPHLYSRPSAMSEAMLRRVVGEMKRVIPAQRDEYFVESDDVFLALWGELVAKEIDARHLIFHLSEGFRPVSRDELGYFLVKEERKELAFIREGFCEKLFKNRQLRWSAHVLVAYQRSSFAESDFDLSVIPEANLIIGLVSRLDKPFVARAIDGVIDFCLNNPSVVIGLVVVGGSPDPSFENQIHEKTNGIANLLTVTLGYLYPIPYSLIQSFDVAIAKSGTVRALSGFGVPCIAYSLLNDDCMGIDGLDFPFGEYADGESVRLETIIEEIVVHDKLCSYEPLRVAPSEADYGDHFEYLGACRAKEFFDTASMKTTMWGFFVTVLTCVFKKRPKYALIDFKKRLGLIR